MQCKAISLVERQKGVNTVQRSSTENHKGAIAIYTLYSKSALLVLNGTVLNSDKTFLDLNQQYWKLHSVNVGETGKRNLLMRYNLISSLLISIQLA